MYLPSFDFISFCSAWFLETDRIPCDTQIYAIPVPNICRPLKLYMHKRLHAIYSIHAVSMSIWLRSPRFVKRKSSSVLCTGLDFPTVHFSFPSSFIIASLLYLCLAGLVYDCLSVVSIEPPGNLTVDVIKYSSWMFKGLLTETCWNNLIKYTRAAFNASYTHYMIFTVVKSAFFSHYTTVWGSI